MPSRERGRLARILFVLPFERAPEDTTMDVHCCNCGEPWDQYHLRHELAGMTPEELTADGWRFGTSRLVVLHCPCCPKDGPGLPACGP
jgi:hypothetical protein